MSFFRPFSEEAHEECEAALPHYVDIIRTQGEDAAQKAMPETHFHLSQCPECTEVLRATRQILDAQKDGTLPKWPGSPAE